MMADSPKNVHIVVPKELREELKALKRPHQAIAGVIEELLEEHYKAKAATTKEID